MKSSARKLVLAGLAVGIGLAAGPASARLSPETQKLVREFPERLKEIKKRQKEFGEQWKNAGTKTEKARIRKTAREFVKKSIIETIIPAWIGTEWAWGADDDAGMPHQEGKKISCSMFVTAVLQNVGLRLDHRPLWANARALYIMRTLAPKLSELKYFHGVTPQQLDKKFAAQKEGIYVIGLNCHVGFLIVSNRKATVVHSDYTDPPTGVRMESIPQSQAILNSQQAGYWITPLFHDDRLIEYWLTDKEVKLGLLGLPNAGKKAALAEIERRRKVIETGIP